MRLGVFQFRPNGGTIEIYNMPAIENRITLICIPWEVTSPGRFGTKYP